MNLLIINLDKNIFSEDSSSLARLKEYSNLVDKIFVIVWTLKKEEPIKYNNKLFIYPTNSKYKFKYYFDTIRVFRNIRKDNKIDLMFTQDPFETGLAGWIIKKIFKIPLQIQVHTEFSSPFFRKESLANRIRFFLAKFLIIRADYLRVVSNRFKKKLIKNYGINEMKITAIPIYADIKSKNVNRWQKTDDNFIFLTVGRLVSVKNIKIQIKAMAEVIKKYPNSELWIVGDGLERKRLEKLCYELRVMSYVKFFGWQNDLDKFYNKADVFLLSSNYEGWGMVIIEAASYGLPIIMTDVGCAGEIIKNGESGIVIPVGDRKKMEEAMIELIEDRELIMRLAGSSIKAISNLPTKEETLRLYLESWKKTLSK